jgi:hypothetical protein
MPTIHHVIVWCALNHPASRSDAVGRCAPGGVEAAGGFTGFVGFPLPVRAAVAIAAPADYVGMSNDQCPILNVE